MEGDEHGCDVAGFVSLGPQDDLNAGRNHGVRHRVLRERRHGRDKREEGDRRPPAHAGGPTNQTTVKHYDRCTP